jgi:hypothetical protein
MGLAWRKRLREWKRSARAKWGRRRRNLLRGWWGASGMEALEARQLLSSSVIINEIMFNPGVSNPGQAGYIPESLSREYIELYNRGSADRPRSTWRAGG